MSIVTRVGLILYVSGVDGDTASLFFGGGVDLVIGTGSSLTSSSQGAGDGSGQRGFTVVNVANRANVDVRLVSLKFCSRHGSLLKVA